MAPRKKSIRKQVAKVEPAKQTKKTKGASPKKSQPSAPVNGSSSLLDTSQRRSARKRPTRRTEAGDPVFEDKDIEHALRIINETSDAGGEGEDYSTALKMVLGVSNGDQHEKQEKKSDVGKNAANPKSPSKRKKSASLSMSDNDIHNDICDDDDDEDQDFEIAKQRTPPASKRGRKRVPTSRVVRSGRKPTQPPEDDDREQSDARETAANPGSTAKRKKSNSHSISDNDIDIDVYDDDDQDGDFEIAKQRIPPPSKRGRKRAPSKQAILSVRKPVQLPEDDDREQTESNERFAAHIRAPRSLENSKYKDRTLVQTGGGKHCGERIQPFEGCRWDVASQYARTTGVGGEVLQGRIRGLQLRSSNLSIFEAVRSFHNSLFLEVYESIPKLRSVSPPRFTTKGICKKKLNCEELGVKIVGKTIGNPFSSHSKRRNGIIYGNQPLNTIEEMEKFTGVALKIKEVLNKQARAVRLSSYVRPDVLSTKRKELVIGSGKRKSNTKVEEDVDIDVDIETVDDGDDYATLEPEDGPKPLKKRHHRGRKPGRTVLECEDCGYKTTHSGHMKVHIVCVHKDVKLLECQYSGCGYRCSRKGSMTRHEKCVHRKDKVFKCEQCSFQSAWSISLERHIITKHEKLKPWTCQICKRSFGQQFTLTQHMNTVHKKMKRIRCAFCAFRSSTKVSVRSHILRMHKAEIAKAVGEVEENGRSGKGLRGRAARSELDDHMMIATFSPLSEADVIGIPTDSAAEREWSIPSTSTKKSAAT